MSGVGNAWRGLGEQNRMETTSFEALPLHDALLSVIEIDWEKRRCCFHLAAFARSGGDATPHLLTFDGVTSFSMPHNEPWGPSSSVNSVSTSGRNFKIEMQSGDVIEINATSHTFAALCLPQLESLAPGAFP